MQNTDDNWPEGAAYDVYMGRWSQEISKAFMQWLDPQPGLRWLDFGCGTGALSTAILLLTNPELVIGCDLSASFIAFAGARNRDPRLSFQVATLGNLPQVSGGFGGIVSGLVLNFIADPVAAIQSLMRRVCPGGLVAAYVWDYAGRMDFLRIFWDVAVSLDAAVELLDEGLRFPLCQPDRLKSTFLAAGLSQVRTKSIDIPTILPTFSDYWEPFLAGTGPAPKYVASLSASQRNQLRATLEQRRVPAAGGKIEMIARAWAVRGKY
jgi:SAM-dependent methyltransferase